MLTVKLGRWQPSHPSDAPPWNRLSDAAVWKEDRYKPLRETLKEPRTVAKLVTTADPSRITAVDLLAGEKTVSRIFIYKATSELPATAEKSKVALIVVHVGPGATLRLTPQALRLLDTCPILIFGTPALVRAIGAEVQRAVPERCRKDVDCWLRPDGAGQGGALPGQDALVKRTMLIYHGYDTIESHRVCAVLPSALSVRAPWQAVVFPSKYLSSSKNAQVRNV